MTQIAGVVSTGAVGGATGVPATARPAAARPAAASPATRQASAAAAASVAAAASSSGVGVPAFPSPPGSQHLGLTIRDYFAAAALQGLACRGLEVKGDRFMTQEQRDEEMAERAWGLAEAMLSHRK